MPQKNVMAEIDFDTAIDNFSKEIDMVPVALERGSYVQDSISTGSLAFDLITGGGYPAGRMTVFSGPPMSGKCLKKGTNVLMHDGSIKEVQNIKLNDKLMGPDSKPRTVQKLSLGKDFLYKIKPVKGGNEWSCNTNHILTVLDKRKKEGWLVDICLRDYFETSAYFREKCKLLRVGVSFKEKPLFLDPYFVGLWLGDGTKDTGIQITNPDIEIIEFIKKFAKKNKLILRLYADCGYRLVRKHLTHQNQILKFIQNNLRNEKTKLIPKEYLINSEKNRLQLLAGLMDSDGHLNKSKKTHYEITTKYENIKDDILFLARSLGFSATSRITINTIKSTGFSGKYHRIIIYGDIWRIPCKVARKKAPKLNKTKDSNSTRFSVIREKKESEFYGFELDSDGRFLLSDFTITHNSTLTFTAEKTATDVGIPVDIFDHEAASDPYYMKRIGLDLDVLCGVKEDGKWIKKPKIRYHQPDTGEQTFRFIQNLLGTLPDKLFINGKWWLLFEDNKVNRARLDKSGVDYLVGMKKEKVKDEQTGEKKVKKVEKLWVEVADGKPQRMEFIDSFAAMMPEVLEDNPDDKGLALQARMFSNTIKTIKSKLGRKRVSLVGTNQIRSKPMTFYGPTEDDMGGWALKFYADMRVSCSQVSGSTIGFTGDDEKSRICKETSWDGNGFDRYVYIKVSTVKNKAFSPFRTTYFRICFEEKGKPGYGIDPFFDLYSFLSETGQLEESRGNFKINIPGFDHRSWTWLEIKELVFNPNLIYVYRNFGFKNAEVDVLLKELTEAKKDPKKHDTLKRKAFEKIKPVVDIRAVCQKQLEDNSAFLKYFDKAGKVKPSSEIEKTFEEAEKLEKEEKKTVKICENCLLFKTKKCKERSKDEDFTCAEFKKGKK